MSSASSFSVTDPDKNIIKSKLSVVYYNVQSLANKVELIEAELHDFDVICLTETWFGIRTRNDLKLNNYNAPYILDRPGDNHGGIYVFVKESIYSQHRTHLEVNDVECLWIKICTRHRKFLLGTFYRPSNSPPSSMVSIKTSIGLAFDTTINDIIVVGNFNLYMQKPTSSRKIETLCQMNNLSNIISEPTHFTESSSTLIDLFLVTNKKSHTS